MRLIDHLESDAVSLNLSFLSTTAKLEMFWLT